MLKEITIRLRLAFLLSVLLALGFQLGHFSEHIIQAGAWLGGFRGEPYMTAFGHHLMNILGGLAYPEADHHRQMVVGNELLHLIGNAIYCFGTIGLLFFIRTKLTITAAIIQAIHLNEHICLTLTTIFVGSPIGMSTLYGLSVEHLTSVSFRVWWHFLMNAIPTILTVSALYEYGFKNIYKLFKP